MDEIKRAPAPATTTKSGNTQLSCDVDYSKLHRKRPANSLLLTLILTIWLWIHPLLPTQTRGTTIEDVQTSRCGSVTDFIAKSHTHLAIHTDRTPRPFEAELQNCDVAPPVGEGVIDDN